MRLDTRFAVLLLSLLLGLSGCMSPETPRVPKWVESPPEASAEAIYGVSVAASKPEAVISAAGGIASALYETAETLLPDYGLDARQTEQTKKALKKALASLDYSRLSVVKEQPMKVKEGEKEDIAVLVSIPRADLLRQVRKRLDDHMQRLDAEILSSATGPAFVRLAVLGKVHEEHPALLADVIVLQTLDPAADVKPYLDYIRKNENAYSRIKFNASVSIISDAGAIRYVEPFKKAFIAEGIRVDGGLARAKASASILLQADRQREHLRGAYHLTVRLRVQTKIGGRTVHTAEYFFKASSARSYGDAQSKTARALMQKIRDIGIFHLLGF